MIENIAKHISFLKKRVVRKYVLQCAHPIRRNTDRACSIRRCWTETQDQTGKTCIDYTVQFVMLSSSLQMQLDIQHSQFYGEDEKGKPCCVLPGMQQSCKL